MSNKTTFIHKLTPILKDGMTKYFTCVLLLFTLTILRVTGQTPLTGQTKDPVKFNITPNIFDSTVTFSFDIQTADSVNISIFDRWAQNVATIIPLQFFAAGKHDTTCNLSNLPPKKYLAKLGVGRTTIYYKGHPRRTDVINLEELLTRRSTNSDKKRDNYTDTTKYYYKVK